MMKKTDDIQSVEMLVLDEYEKGNFRSRLRLVKYIVDQVEKDPKLENRQFYKTAEGEWRMGKNMGLRHGDLQKVIDNWIEINDLMVGLAKVPEPKSVEPEPEPKKTEDLPF